MTKQILSSNSRVAWLARQATQAREIEQIYEFSRAVFAEAWSPQAEQLLKQVQDNRLYFEQQLKGANDVAN